MAGERKYMTPDFDSDRGTESSTKIPDKTLIAAAPASDDNITDKGTNIDAGRFVATPEGKMSPDNVPARQYATPDFELPTITETIQNQPKDTNQVAALAHLPGQATTGSKTTSSTSFSDLYTIPKAGRSVNGKWTEYTPEELAANPSLNTEAQTEAYFRSRMNNPTEPDSNKVARAYLDMVGNDEYIKNRPADIAPQYDFSLSGTHDYQRELSKFQAEDNAARAKANEAKRKIADEVAKGNFDFADQLVKDQALKVKVHTPSTDGKPKLTEYRASSPEAAKNALFLEKMSPVAKEASEAVDKLNGSSSQVQVKQVAAKVARVAAMYYNPGQAVTMGDIGETEVANVANDLEKAGFGANAFIALVSWFTMPDEEAAKYDGILDFAMKKFGNITQPYTPEEAKKHLKATLDAAKKTKEEYYKAGALVGYKGSDVAGGSDTKDDVTTKWKPEQIPDKDFESTVNPDKDKLVLGSMLRWQKMTEPDQKEIDLGIKSGYDGNAGVDAVQSYLKEILGATSYNPTGILDPENDSKLVAIYFNKYPTKSAKDLISEALDYFEDARPDSPSVPKKKPLKPNTPPVIKKKIKKDPLGIR